MEPTSWPSGYRNVLQLTEPITPDALLGRSMFSIFSNSFERIPIEQNIEFYSKKSSMVKRMKADASVELLIYDPFHCCNEDRSAT